MADKMGTFHAALSRRMRVATPALPAPLSDEDSIAAVQRLFSPIACADFLACVRQGAMFPDDIMRTLATWGRNSFSSEVLDLMVVAGHGRALSSDEPAPFSAQSYRKLAAAGVTSGYLQGAMQLGVSDSAFIAKAWTAGVPVEYLGNSQ